MGNIPAGGAPGKLVRSASDRLNLSWVLREPVGCGRGVQEHVYCVNGIGPGIGRHGSLEMSPWVVRSEAQEGVWAGEAQRTKGTEAVMEVLGVAWGWCRMGRTGDPGLIAWIP